MEATIRVLQEDIDNGEAYNCQRCAVALGMKRVFPDYVVDADASTLSLWSGPGPEDVEGSLGELVWITETPEITQNLIFNFDDGEPVEPIEFTVTFRKPDTA